MSDEVVSLHNVSAVNFIVGWFLFACSMNCSTTSLLVFQWEIISLMQRFQTTSLLALLSRICFSIFNFNFKANA